MPGNKNSIWPTSRQPYVRLQEHGRPYDIGGKLLSTDKLEAAHIPLDKFTVPKEMFNFTK
jgi:hypothetical protein